MKNMHNKKLYLYGAGADGKVILCFLHDVNIKVDGVCDKRFETIDSLENVPVISFESTLEEEAVYLITSTKYKKEITEILKNSGKKFYCNLFSLLVFLYMNRLPYYYFYINGSTKTYPRCWLLYRMCNEISISKRVRKQIKLDLRGYNNRIYIPNNAKFKNVTILMQGNNNELVVGDNCEISDCLLRVDFNGHLKIGARSYMYGGLFNAQFGRTLTVGEDCLFSSEIDIETSEHPIYKDGKRINNGADVCIGNHVWLGRRCTLLKGAIIPNNSVVGANSVVTRAFRKDNIVIAGNPASVIKEDIDGRTW